MFGHAHVTTPTCRKYRTSAPPLKFPSYATAYICMCVYVYLCVWNLNELFSQLHSAH